jgi:hypothetical protein
MSSRHGGAALDDRDRVPAHAVLDPDMRAHVLRHAGLAVALNLRHGGLADIGRKGHGPDGSVRLAMSDASEKARRAAREMVGDYHERELGAGLERVGEGFARPDAGELDAFELDDLMHRYKRSARELWKSCSLGASAAWALEDARERGEQIDWWAAVPAFAPRPLRAHPAARQLDLAALLAA